jgi:hypothetical protein
MLACWRDECKLFHAMPPPIVAKTLGRYRILLLLIPLVNCIEVVQAMIETTHIVSWSMRTRLKQLTDH